MQVAARANIFTKIIHQDLLGRANNAFAVKANIGCGYPASAGTPGLARDNWVPKDSSPVVSSLIDKGYKVAAITNMHELAFGITSENPAFGDVENPRSPGYIPGGSSGGSAAAVAMGAVPFALGTDTGGSMRIPAALCGVVGYRPTIGLYPTSAVCPLSSTTDTIGIFSRSVKTVQEAHKAIIPSYSPKALSLAGVRIGVPHLFYYSHLEDEVRRLTEEALKALKGAGAELVYQDIPFPPDLDKDHAMTESILDLVIYETYRLLPKYLQEQCAPVNFEELCDLIRDPAVKEVISTGHKVSKEAYQECKQLAEKLSDLLRDYFKANDLAAYIVPTTILCAKKRPCPGSVQVAGRDFPALFGYVHNSIIQASAGVPCISLPNGLTSEGLAVGLELVAPRGEDSNLLNLAAAVQDLLPTMPSLPFDPTANMLCKI